MKFILKKLENKKNRSAYFICSFSYKEPNGKIFNTIGKIHGRISNKILGNKGFGYDPIFLPENKNQTFGQMQKSKKIKMDHRFLAFKKMKNKIKTL